MELQPQPHRLQPLPHGAAASNTKVAASATQGCSLYPPRGFAAHAIMIYIYMAHAIMRVWQLPPSECLSSRVRTESRPVWGLLVWGWSPVWHTGPRLGEGQDDLAQREEGLVDVDRILRARSEGEG
eukprot:scaffold54708_cov26-Phaeocystis_antarctica.AAC.1